VPAPCASESSGPLGEMKVPRPFQTSPSLGLEPPKSTWVFVCVCGGGAYWLFFFLFYKYSIDSFLFPLYCGLNSGPCSCEASTLNT
jgi:hypothetical protein